LFRKLYWVTEQVSEDGSSRVGGVYTSIPDLVRHGIKFVSDAKLRLTLTKLDSEGAPLGCWQSPEFDAIEDALRTYVQTEEFTADQCAALVQALHPATSHQAA
jgi:hypothetical protein